VSRQAQWRAAFALQLYEELDSAEVPALQHELMRAGISILRLLVGRFWHKSDIGLMRKLLRSIAEQRVGKRLIAAALDKGDRQVYMRAMTDAEQAFGKRIEQCAHAQRTTKLLKKAGAVLTLPPERDLLRSIKWLREPEALPETHLCHA
jgi:hypothetical protein